MTQAVTAVRAYVREIDEPVTNRFLQTLIVETSGANTDVTYDLGLYVSGSLGTFWTAVGADASYGQIALGLIRGIATLDSLYLGDQQTPQLQARDRQAGGQIVTLTSSAIAGGSASATATITALLSTDVVMSVTQSTANANSLVPVAVGAVSAGSLALTYASDPGANGIVKVVVYRKTGTLIVGIGQYSDVASNQASNITFASTDAPTAAQFVLQWELKPGCHGIKYPATP